MALQIQTLGTRQYFYGTLAEILAGDDDVVEGDLGYATNGRKAAEGAAAGTGNQMFHDGTNWIRVDTGATADA